MKLRKKPVNPRRPPSAPPVWPAHPPTPRRARAAGHSPSPAGCRPAAGFRRTGPARPAQWRLGPQTTDQGARGAVAVGRHHPQPARMSTALRERLSLIVGTVSAHKDGHGFLMPDDRSAPIYLAPRQMAEAMHGDRAAVRVSGTDHRGRPEGSIVEVLERNTREIVGRLLRRIRYPFRRAGQSTHRAQSAGPSASTWARRGPARSCW